MIVVVSEEKWIAVVYIYLRLYYMEYMGYSTTEVQYDT